MLLHLLHTISPLLMQQRNSEFVRILNFNDVPFAFKKKIRRRNSASEEKDSEFEVDPDTAREALRKLDQQFESLSNKQVNTPKIRAVELDQTSPWITNGTSEISGSFLTFLASALLIFSIFYNVLFIMVIKPSIDGRDAEEPVTSQEGAPVQQLLTSRKFPVGM